MAFEDIILSSSFRQPKVWTDEVKIVRVKEVKDEGIYCDVLFDNPQNNSLHFSGKDQVAKFKGLKEGDLAILVQNEHEVKMFYGPLSRDNLFLISPYRLSL